MQTHEICDEGMKRLERKMRKGKREMRYPPKIKSLICVIPADIQEDSDGGLDSSSSKNKNNSEHFKEKQEVRNQENYANGMKRLERKMRIVRKEMFRRPQVPSMPDVYIP